MKGSTIGSQVTKRDADGNTKVGKDGDLQSHKRIHTCVTVTVIFHTCRSQLGDERVQLQNVFRVVGYKMGEIGGGLGHREIDGAAFGEEDVGVLRRRREDEIGREGKEVLESERERVFESGNDGL